MQFWPIITIMHFRSLHRCSWSCKTAAGVHVHAPCTLRTIALIIFCLLLACYWMLLHLVFQMKRALWRIVTKLRLWDAVHHYAGTGRRSIRKLHSSCLISKTRMRSCSSMQIQLAHSCATFSSSCNNHARGVPCFAVQKGQLCVSMLLCTYPLCSCECTLTGVPNLRQK